MTTAITVDHGIKLHFTKTETTEEIRVFVFAGAKDAKTSEADSLKYKVMELQTQVVKARVHENQKRNFLHTGAT